MILVVGATGQLGGAIARLLLAQGQPVRALVRAGSDYQPLVAAGAQPVLGDMKDRASLDAACAGADVVITTANAAQRGGADTFDTVDRQGNINLIDAAASAGVRHFIFTSALGSDPNSPNPLVAAKGVSEAHLRASGMPFTILGANIFMEVWIGMIVGIPLQMGQPVALVGQGDHRHSFVSARDVAAFAVAAVNHPAALNQYLPIGGPEALTWTQVVERVGRAIGRDLPVRYMPPGEPLPGVPDTVQGLAQMMETYESVIDMAGLAQTFGVQQVTIDDYARAAFAS